MQEKLTPYFFLIVFGVLNLFFWQYSHKIQREWANVPPTPPSTSLSNISLGDTQLAYRLYGMSLQTLGNEDGDSFSLKDYDYNLLKKWFFALDSLDPVSDFVPMLAAYYYGAVNDNEKVDLVIDYLSQIGQSAEGSKWRWLAHAVNLAQYQQKDNERALELAYLLAENKNPNMADWGKQLPVFILQKEGQTKLAYDIMLNILIDNVDTMHPNEIYYMKDYICNILLVGQNEIPAPVFCKEVER